jgi:hypothetical protein
MIRKLIFPLTFWAWAALAPNAGATLIFDLSPDNATTNRGPNSGPGQGVAVSTTTTITQMAMDIDMPSGGDIKYMIWDGTNSTLLFSQTQAVSPSSTQSFVLSGLFSFTLNAGSTYYFGVIGDNNLNVGFIFPSSPYSANGLAAVDGANSNYTNFATPADVGGGGADIGLRLFSGTTAAPEPSSLMLCAAGLVWAGLKRMSRVKGQK